MAGPADLRVRQAYNDREVRRAQALRDGTPWPDRAERRRMDKERQCAAKAKQREPLRVALAEAAHRAKPKAKRPPVSPVRKHKRVTEARAYLRDIDGQQRPKVGPHHGPALRPVSAAMLRWLESLPDPDGLLAEQIPIARAYNQRIEQDRWPQTSDHVRSCIAAGRDVLGPSTPAR